MALKIFIDFLSQPSRSVVLFAKLNNIPFVLKETSIAKGAHQTDEFAAINPFKKVPAIQDGDFNLSESVAILRYLISTYKTPDHWYPADVKKRAKVDEYLAWQHLNTRMTCAKVFWTEYLIPRMTGSPVNTSKLESNLSAMNQSFTDIEDVFLKDQQYLCGDDITIADIMGVSEVLQVTGSGRDPAENHPKLGAWVERVQKRLNPEFDEVFKILFKIRDKSRARSKL
ncbi:glutathione S-transferase theta-1-like [Anneissia japonica]|uniref:glutathione S-transferase theta-1-like n=1 Tax=Anneissia japonica TaxID=1529436 RepID=UPI001425A45A|nr:glutathione S-transferase theta-1-like [Anneissia japonica]